MKKIISIILGILLMFSMSVTSFAAWVNVPAAEETTTKVVEVKTDFATSSFVKASTDTAVLTKGKLTIKIDNKSDSSIQLSDLTIGITATSPKLKANAETEATSTDAKKYVLDLDKEGNIQYFNPIVSIDGWSHDSDFVITKYSEDTNSDTATIVCDIYVVYDCDKLTYEGTDKKAGDCATVFTITINGISQNTTFNTLPGREDKVEGGWLTWELIPAPVVDTTPDASNPAEDEDTSTEDTDVTPPADDKEDDITPPADEDVNTPDTDKGDENVNVETPDEKDEPADDPAPVDPEIPDTGATVPFAAIGTLVTSAITALVAKKKKEN